MPIRFQYPFPGIIPVLTGRLLMYYSPVRHSFRQASLPSLVRLACIRHAASVRPEPGSNSHLNENISNMLQLLFFCPFISERFIVELTVGCLSLNNRCTWFVFCFIQFSKVYFVCLVLTRQLFNSTKTFLTCQHLFEKFFYFLFLRS